MYHKGIYKWKKKSLKNIKRHGINMHKSLNLYIKDLLSLMLVSQSYLWYCIIIIIYNNVLKYI